MYRTNVRHHLRRTHSGKVTGVVRHSRGVHEGMTDRGTTVVHFSSLPGKNYVMTDAKGKDYLVFIRKDDANWSRVFFDGKYSFDIPSHDDKYILRQIREKEKMEVQ